MSVPQKSFGEITLNRRIYTAIYCVFFQTRNRYESSPPILTFFSNGRAEEEKLFGSSPEVFRAPALPLGNEFRGIVHVHGSVVCPERMVLTDADFGRAYIVEGWAQRFLVELFGCFTVLFVGYSHNDTIMNYLARALPVEEECKAFRADTRKRN